MTPPRSLVATLLVILAIVALLPAPARSGKKAGGRLAVGLADGDLASLDPIVPADGASTWALLHLYDQLVRVGRDGRRVEPAAAESWKVSPDGKTWTFRLRRGLTFSNGDPVTSEDVRFSLERAMGRASSRASRFPPMAGAAAPDPRTVVIHLREPWAPLLADLSLLAASIIPARLAREKGRAFWKAPVGSGPFMVTEWVKGRHITLRRNPAYWQKPYPYLDEVRFEVLADDRVRVERLRRGDIDIATSVPPDQVAGFQRDDRFDVYLVPLMRVDHALLNHARSPFGALRARQAINHAVNRDAIVRRVLFGYGRVASSMLPPMLYWNDTLRPYAYSVSLARAALRQAGMAGGFSAEMLIAAGDGQAAHTGALMRQQLKAAGIDLRVTTLPPAHLLRRRQAGQFDMLKHSYSSDITDPGALVGFALDYEDGALARWAGYRNPRISRLARQAQATMSPERRRTLYFEIQRLAYDDYYAVPLYYADTRTVVAVHVRNFRQFPTGYCRLWEAWRAR
ncbi:MAG: ABC transporter substrate-binding protein [Armatimonadetes bacterium]|nr:ABC transporter substrate-binding protein [Armatimonadota bacterium]